MAVVSGDLGKASLTINGPHDSSYAYEKLCVVSANGISYVSRKAVPAGIAISNSEYWMPMTDDAAAAAAAAAAANNANTALENIAPIFSTDDSYPRGAFVIREGILYRYLKNHAAGAWDADEVEQVIYGEEVADRKRKYKRPFRYLFVSDTHLTDNNWYSVYDQNRLNKLIRDLNFEIDSKNIDGIFGLGDYSLDYWISGGTLPNYSTTDRFCKKFLPKLKKSIYLGPGNHEGGYTNDEWLKMTGMNRQFTVIDEDKDVAVIFLDTWADSVHDEYASDGVYTQVDTDYLQEQLDLCKGKTVFICAHYFYTDGESSAFKNIVKNNDDIVALLAGHTHQARTIDLGEDYGNKKLYETGNFSYYSGSRTESMWGFREMFLTENGIETEYIIPPYKAKISDVEYDTDYEIASTSVVTTAIVSEESISNIIEDLKIFNDTDVELEGILNTGDDLNDYKSYGKYVSPNTSISNSLLNGPHTNYSGGFILQVERMNGSWGSVPHIIQTIIPGVRDNGRAQRLYNSSSSQWEAWRELEDEVISHKNDSYYKNKSLKQCLPINIYKYVEQNDPFTLTLNTNYNSGVWEIYALTCIGGTIVGYKKWVVLERYTDAGSIAVFEAETKGSNSASLSNTSTAVTISTGSSALRIFAKKIQ